MNLEEKKREGNKCLTAHKLAHENHFVGRSNFISYDFLKLDFDQGIKMEFVLLTKHQRLCFFFFLFLFKESR